VNPEKFKTGAEPIQQEQVKVEYKAGPEHLDQLKMQAQFKTHAANLREQIIDDDRE